MFAFVVPFSKTFDDVGLLYKVPVSLQEKLKLGQVVEIPIKNKFDLGVVYRIEISFNFSLLEKENSKPPLTPPYQEEKGTKENSPLIPLHEGEQKTNPPNFLYQGGEQDQILPNPLHQEGKQDQVLPLNKGELEGVFQFEDQNPPNSLYQGEIKEDFIDISKIKEIRNIKNENIFLSGYRLELLLFIAKHYFCTIHNSLSLFFPKNLLEKIKKDKLEFEKTLNYSYLFNFSITLTQAQERVYNSIKSSKNNKILLFGVTGSGKTEIYIKLINDIVKTGKQVLFLIPEIILGNQILERIKEIFGNDVIILNSTVSEAKKTQYFLDILHNKAKIVLGTRSALFYPYNNLGLIIIDEEHDNSYISEKAPRYNSVEVAEKIVEISGKLKVKSGKEGIKLLLASGTPSVSSMYLGVKGKYELISLLEKYK